jgi:uncharacterized protein YfiM (DUF2279 family)
LCEDSWTLLGAGCDVLCEDSWTLLGAGCDVLCEDSWTLLGAGCNVLCEDSWTLLGAGCNVLCEDSWTLLGAGCDVLKLKYISVRGREELMGRHIKWCTKMGDHLNCYLNLLDLSRPHTVKALRANV